MQGRPPQSAPSVPPATSAAWTQSQGIQPAPPSSHPPGEDLCGWEICALYKVKKKNKLVFEEAKTIIQKSNNKMYIEGGV